MWVTGGASNTINRVSPDGTVTSFPVPTPSASPRMITVGADKNLWFTEQGGNKIGRITTAGVVTEFAVPTAGAQPFGIAPGPDGNLWFTELVGNKIGRITVTGTITEFAIPTASAGAYGIVAAPDSQTMHFTESTTDKIGSVSMSGAFGPEIALAAGAKPRGITTFAGKTWVAEFGTSKLAQVSGTTVTETALDADSQPTWLAIGPGPTLWVSLNGTSRVAAVNATGAASGSYAFASGAQPGGLAQGPDGNMWVALTAFSQVARVLTGQVPMIATAPAITPQAATPGGTLSTTAGTWEYLPSSFAYQWQRCGTTATGACTDIAGATSSTFTTATTDSGQYVTVRVTATNINGASVAKSATPVLVSTAAVPTTTPGSTLVKPVVTVSAPAKIKRGKTKVITVTVTPTNAAGSLEVKVKKGSRSKVIATIPVTNGSAAVSWKVTKKWPTGATKVVATFTPTDKTVFASAKGKDTIAVR